jgi:hypothetical protein
MADEVTSLDTSHSVIASDWMLWEKLLNYGSTSALDTRELAIEQSVEAFLSGMQEDPAYQADATVNGTSTPLIASRSSALECDIKAIPGTNLHIGDLVSCLNEDWLVVELYTDKVGIIEGKMWVCNDILHFQNHSPDIIRRRCVVDDGSYSRKSTDPIAYIPTNTYKLYVSLDEKTVQLYIDKRLALNEIYDLNGDMVLEVYKIVGLDLKSKNFGEGSHLMVLTLQRDVYNESADDYDNLICDAYVSPINTAVSSAAGGCKIVGKDVVRIGTTRKYWAVFTDSNESVVAATPRWTVAPPTGVNSSVTDGVVSIQIPLDSSLIGKKIMLAVTDEEGLYGSCEKEVQVIAVG